MRTFLVQHKCKLNHAMEKICFVRNWIKIMAIDVIQYIQWREEREKRMVIYNIYLCLDIACEQPQRRYTHTHTHTHTH